MVFILSKENKPKIKMHTKRLHTAYKRNEEVFRLHLKLLSVYTTLFNKSLTLQSIVSSMHGSMKGYKSFHFHGSRYWLLFKTKVYLEGNYAKSLTCKGNVLDILLKCNIGILTDILLPCTNKNGRNRN